jgi:hypothetical protein
VLVDGPQFDPCLRERGRDRMEQWTQVGDECGVRRWAGGDVVRPGLQPADAEPSQGAPTQLPADAAPAGSLPHAAMGMPYL